MARRRRLLGCAGLWVGFVLIPSVLGPHHPMSLALGGDGRIWLILGVVAGLVLIYRAWLARLRARHRAAPEIRAAANTAPITEPLPPFSDAEIQRYARHIMLREIGGPGQQRLKAARVLVIGAGGLGSPALMYLAAAGVGVIGVIDDDVVEASNLQRQVIHVTARIGLPKVLSAQDALNALNPFVTVQPYKSRFDESSAAALIGDYDLVLDGSDNFTTRYLANRLCAAQGTPLIAAALTQWEGQISLYDPVRGGPCYACVFPTPPHEGVVPSCAEAGVAAPLPGILGAQMASEALKVITGAGTDLRGRLMLHDALHSEWRSITVKARHDCPVCGGAGGLNPNDTLARPSAPAFTPDNQ